MKNVPLTAIAGQTCRLPLVVKNADGTPVPLEAYDIYGAVDDGSPVKTSMAVALIEPGTACLSIPPLQTGRYEYDVFMRHQATSTETRLLRGAITVQSRVASLPPAQSTSEQINIVLSPEHTVLEISLSPVTIVSAADWRQIQEAADRAERAAGQAEATLPALEREIAAARTTIEQEADQAARHAAADTADIIAASGEAATSAVREEASRATSAALESISTAEATAINQAVNNGINAIGQSITAGTGTISEATASGKSSIDSYVLTTQADLARKSTANIWSGVQTINAPLVANGGIILQPTSSATSVGTHMSAWLWASTYCTERVIPYAGKWTAASWAGNSLNYETYTLLGQSATPQRMTCMSRVDIASLAHYRNSMDESKGRLACGFEARNASTYVPHAGLYPWDWASGDELRIVDTPRHAVRCMMIRRAYAQQTAWRMIYPGKLEDLLSLQIISRGTEWHNPVYVGCHVSRIYAIECSYNRSTNPVVTSDVGQYSSILAGGSMWINRVYFNDRSNQDRRDLPPAVTIYAHAIPLRNWTVLKRWPEEQSLVDAADKSWVDWRYVAASLDYTPSASEVVIVATNIGRHVYVTPAAQSIGLTASVYRPAAGGGTLLPDGVCVDIDTASAWLTHSGGALHLTANTTGAERIASVWLYSDQGVGTIYELQIHQST